MIFQLETRVTLHDYNYVHLLQKYLLLVKFQNVIVTIRVIFFNYSKITLQTILNYNQVTLHTSIYLTVYFLQQFMNVI